MLSPLIICKVLDDDDIHRSCTIFIVRRCFTSSLRLCYKRCFTSELRIAVWVCWETSVLFKRLKTGWHPNSACSHTVSAMSVYQPMGFILCRRPTQTSTLGNILKYSQFLFSVLIWSNFGKRVFEQVCGSLHFYVLHVLFAGNQCCQVFDVYNYLRVNIKLPRASNNGKQNSFKNCK